MLLKPLHDKIVVKPIERVKSSLIHVIMDEKDNMGTVVAVGPGTVSYTHLTLPTIYSV